MLHAPHRKLEVSNLLSGVLPYRGEVPVPNGVFGDLAVSSHASANTKGASWTNLLDPIPLDFEGFTLAFLSDTASRGFLVDLALGPSGGGSEDVIVANMHFSAIPAGRNGSTVYLPLAGRGAGQRLSARCQASTGGSVIGVAGHFRYTRTWQRLLRSVETYGADTADSGGTSVDPGGSAGSKGLYSTLGTTTKAIHEICLAFGNQNNTVRASTNWFVDVAIGATPTIIVGDITLGAHVTNDWLFPQFWGPVPVEIPAGTDVKVRASCSITDATDRLFDCVVYGFSEAK